MRRVALIVLLSITAAATAALADDKDKTPFKAKAAASYPGAQTLDKITIGAMPYGSSEQAAEAFGKVDPYKYGILPVLVVIENNTGKTLRLDLQAQFVDPQNRHVDAMPAGDVVLFNGDRKQSWKVPTPSPLPIPRKAKKGPLNTWEIEGRAFAAKLIPPGETASGFFYFFAENRPGSKLYLTGIKDAASGKDYFYFDVPFEKQD
jgi:hypothetical protein